MIELPGFRDIGNLGKECPYCGVEFQKRPGKQRQCPACQNVVHVRLRPLDRQDVLVTKAQTDDIKSERRLVDAIRWRDNLLESARKNDVPNCIYWLKSLSSTVGSIGMTKDSVRLAIAALMLEGDQALRECCGSIHFAQKHHGYLSSEMSEDYDAARSMISKHLTVDVEWDILKDKLATEYLEFMYKISQSQERQPSPPPLPPRKIKGVLREYDVHAKDSISDTVCEGIVRTLEEEGKLPFRNVSQPGTNGVLLAMAFGSWRLSTDSETYEVMSFENMIGITIV